jgi:mannose-6-phosphate isomerase-like protein (cupin superfamily)
MRKASLPVMLFACSALFARDPLSARIAHTDPAKYKPYPGVHGGAGTLDLMPLFGDHDFGVNLYFLHRGVLEPKGGIGAHFHNTCEEMFVILDGEAQFTIDGRTSLLKAPAGALCQMGHSHAIYNATDKPVQWMNINVGRAKSKYDNFDLGDTRVGAALDPIPTFITMRLDREMLKPTANSILYRRALPPDVFFTNWSYVDHVVVPSGRATAKERHENVEEFYYVMKGEGSASVGDETAPIHAGDAVPVLFNEPHSFSSQTGELELMVVGIARARFALN